MHLQSCPPSWIVFDLLLRHKQIRANIPPRYAMVAIRQSLKLVQYMWLLSTSQVSSFIRFCLRKKE